MKISKIAKQILCGLIPFAGIVAVTAAPPAKSHDAAILRNLNTFNAVVKTLEENYVDSVNTDKNFRDAIQAYLASTDPYTEYYDQKDTEKLRRLTTGEYGGIGSMIMQRNGSTYISAPLKGSPAARAGLRAGDKLLRVDTVDVSRMGSEDVTKLLKGIPGTHVNIEVLRPFAKDSVLTFDIVRGKVVEQSVPFDTLIGNTGYIRITSFMDKTAELARGVLEKFKKNPNLNGVIIDLRSNGGGLMESGIDLVSNFVPKGTEIVKTIGKNAEDEKLYKTVKKPILPDIPVAVLIDGGTASASEIVAGSLQDLDRAVLLGTRSFGKGLVQRPLPLPYNGLLKVTIAKYYLPSGRLIQAIDYSHRNPDGTVAPVPDSLTNVFHTAIGREVRDGGGLRPDSTVNWGEVNRLVYNVVTDQWAFDFATKYVAEHPQPVPPQQFVVTDEIFEQFKKSIDPERFKYDRVCEDALKQLNKLVETEGYMKPEVKEQLDKLSGMLTHNLNQDLDNNRKQLSEYIGGEIMERYGYEPYRIAYDIKDDSGVATAISLFSNPTEYYKILGKDIKGKPLKQVKK